jgi:predicted metal-dependent hydrolase
VAQHKIETIDKLGAYTLLRSKRKTLAIHIKEGQIFVKAPLNAPKTAIETWVNSKQSWIDKHLLAFQHKQAHQNKHQNIYDYSENSYIPYMGGRIQIKEHATTHFDGQCLYMPSKYIHAAYIEYWYKEQAHKQYQQLIDYWQDKMQLFCKEWCLSHGKKHLGYCTQNGKIAISWYLIMQPLYVIEYVIIHEIAHLLHFNHSKNFWLLVEHYCPQYKKAIDYLRNKGLVSVV